MNLKSGVVASVRFGQIKKKLGWKTSDVPTSGAIVTNGFTPINKVTKKKTCATGSARVKRACKASAHEEDAQDDEEGSGDAEAKEDNSDQIKHGDEGKGYVTNAHHSCEFSKTTLTKES